jgi:hypothetical protein
MTLSSEAFGKIFETIANLVKGHRYEADKLKSELLEEFSSLDGFGEFIDFAFDVALTDNLDQDQVFGGMIQQRGPEPFYSDDAKVELLRNSLQKLEAEHFK